MSKIVIACNEKNPGIPETIDAFAGAYDPCNPRTVNFMVAEGGTVSMKVTALEYESGAPGMFVIGGYVMLGGSMTHMSGFYNANRKEGVLKPTAAAKKAG